MLAAIKNAFFAAKVSRRLTELKIDVRKLDIPSARALREVGMTKSMTFSAHEAALYFFVFAIPELDESCFLLPVDRDELAGRAEILSSLWVRRGKVRAPMVEAIFKNLRKRNR